jgi:hypothetical protein
VSGAWHVLLLLLAVLIGSAGGIGLAVLGLTTWQVARARRDLGSLDGAMSMAERLTTSAKTAP